MDSILDQLSLGTLSDNFVNERIDPGVALSMSDSALPDLSLHVAVPSPRGKTGGRET